MKNFLPFLFVLATVPTVAQTFKTQIGLGIRTNGNATFTETLNGGPSNTYLPKENVSSTGKNLSYVAAVGVAYYPFANRTKNLFSISPALYLEGRFEVTSYSLTQKVYNDVYTNPVVTNYHSTKARSYLPALEGGVRLDIFDLYLKIGYSVYLPYNQTDNYWTFGEDVDVYTFTNYGKDYVSDFIYRYEQFISLHRSNVGKSVSAEVGYHIVKNFFLSFRFAYDYDFLHSVRTSSFIWGLTENEDIYQMGKFDDYQRGKSNFQLRLNYSF